MDAALIRISSAEFFRVYAHLRLAKVPRALSEASDPDVVATVLRRDFGRNKKQAGPGFVPGTGHQRSGTLKPSPPWPSGEHEHGEIHGHEETYCQRRKCGSLSCGDGQ